MSVLVFAENRNGKFPKSTLELVCFASELSRRMSLPAVAVSIGAVAPEELKSLGKYGISRVISLDPGTMADFEVQALSGWITQEALTVKAAVILLRHSNLGKVVAPCLSASLKAGLAAAVTGFPVAYEPFTVTRKVFTGKALATVAIKTPLRILTLAPNSYHVEETPVEVVVETRTPEVKSSYAPVRVIEVTQQSGKILLSEAEIVVSGGRGMKGPENWGPILELADLLGAATACSRPVADEGWRPHAEHVGQTGKIIAPNLYIACGISGAIQHLGGISSSKCIVAVNKDPEAPIFEAADYGIVGDVFRVLPDLISAFRQS